MQIEIMKKKKSAVFQFVKIHRKYDRWGSRTIKGTCCDSSASSTHFRFEFKTGRKHGEAGAFL